MKHRILNLLIPFDAYPVERDPNELNRVSTTLELYFDLVYVIAISSAVQGFHDAIVANRGFEGFLKFTFCFFIIWRSWSNFSWFSSAFDDKSSRFTINTMILMLGSIFLAIGVKQIFFHNNLWILLLGFFIMRIGLAAMWIFVAARSRKYRKIALSFVSGIFLTQALWLVAGNTGQYFWSIFWAFIILEVLITYFTERHLRTPWHPNHIAERFGLFTIIMLGEAMLGTVKVLTPLTDNQNFTELFFTGTALSILLMSLFWLYFKMPFAIMLQQCRKIYHDKNSKSKMIIAYGHLLMYFSIALICVCLRLIADVVYEQANPTLMAVEGANGSQLLPIASTTAIYVDIFLTIAVGLFLISIIIIRSFSYLSQNFDLRGFVLAMMVNLFSVILVYFGSSLFWVVMLQAVAPIAMIVLYSPDELDKIKEEKELFTFRDAKTVELYKIIDQENSIYGNINQHKNEDKDEFGKSKA